jgi:GT2 family glycosyltransferase
MYYCNTTLAKTHASCGCADLLPKGLDIQEAHSYTRPAQKETIIRFTAMRRQTPEECRFMIDLATIIVNHNTPQLTIQTVRSVLRSNYLSDLVIIIDNGSSDNSADIFAEALPEIQVYRLDKNRGYAAGLNQGIQAAITDRARQFLFLNSDVILDEKCIEILIAELHDHPEAGIAGPAILKGTSGRTIESLGISLQSITGRMRLNSFGQTLPQTVQPSTQVDAVSGCVMLVRNEVLLSIGTFDEAYFHGFEEIDFCLRAHAAGFQTRNVSEALAHHRGASTLDAGSDLALYYTVRNHLRLASRMFPNERKIHRVIRNMSVVAFNVAHASLRSKCAFTPAIAATLKGVLDHFRHNYGPKSP